VYVCDELLVYLSYFGYIHTHTYIHHRYVGMLKNA
jgi:hypothetical protein